MRSQSSYSLLKAQGFFEPKTQARFESGENFSEAFCSLSQNATAEGTANPEVNSWEGRRQ